MEPSFTANVHIIGGVGPDNEEVTKAHIGVLGLSPHATVKLSQRNNLEKRFIQLDILTNATITELQIGDESVVRFEGTSAQMVDEVGLESANAIVRWDAYLMDCPTC